MANAERHKTLQLRPLQEIIDEIRVNAEKDAKRMTEYCLKNGEQMVKKAEHHRQALMNLDAVGVPMSFSAWSRGFGTNIELGFFPNTKKGNTQLANAIRRILHAVGSGLEKDHETRITNAKKHHVHVSRRLKDFPGIEIRYERKLPKGSKCKIVRTRETSVSLVCPN